jgi:hypothetical protein
LFAFLNYLLLLVVLVVVLGLLELLVEELRVEGVLVVRVEEFFEELLVVLLTLLELDLVVLLGVLRVLVL